MLFALVVSSLLPGEARPAGAGAGGDARPVDAGKKVVLKVYDVRDVTSLSTDFPAPHLSCLSVIPVNPFARRQAASCMAAPDLAQLLQERLLAKEFSDPATSIEESGGKLVVMQRPEVHARILKILKEFHSRFTRRCSIQALEIAMEVPKALEWMGKAGRPVRRDKVEALLKKKGSGSRLVSAPQMVVFNRQQGHLLAGRIASIMSDSDINGAVYDPVMDARLDGMVLEARPVLDFEGRRVYLDLRYLRGTTLPSVNRVDFETIIYERESVTVVEKDAASKKEVKTERYSVAEAIGKHRVRFKWPRQRRRRFNAVLTVPLGTWVLAGMLDPTHRASKGKLASKVLLVFVRCDVVRDLVEAK
jgi:hypothetical protein